MKKTICLLLLFVMLVSVTSCSDSKLSGTEPPVTTTAPSNSVESEQPDIPSPTVTVDSENEATATDIPTTPPSTESTSTPTQEPTIKPAEKTPEPVERGTLTIPAVYAFVGYPASDIYVKFSVPEMAEKLNYKFEGDGIKIDADKNTVTALKKGSYTVVAYSENFETSFSVYAKDVDKTEAKYDPSKFSSQAADRLSQWEKDGVDGKTTLFIGDSFFDTYFWSDFYTKYYSDKDALLLGIGSTTTYDWEVWADEWLGKTSPKNIVINIGTNNVYDDGDNVDDAVLALKRLFIVLHNKFPDAQIYWYGISQRAYDDAKIKIVSNVNKKMKNWCDLCDYVTYVDASRLTNNDLKDGVHPQLEKYSIFTDALSKADIVIENKSGN